MKNTGWRLRENSSRAATPTDERTREFQFGPVAITDRPVIILYFVKLYTLLAPLPLADLIPAEMRARAGALRFDVLIALLMRQLLSRRSRSPGKRKKFLFPGSSPRGAAEL